jgi:hypothetical protein
MGSANLADVIGELREQLVPFKTSRISQDIVNPKERVLARFQPIFTPEHMAQITREEFLSFLLFQNNQHWTGLHRQGPRMVSDMAKLREALRGLLDESQDISHRLDRAIGMVYGMGKNVATAILLVAHPDKYGVWNNRSEAVIKERGLWPDFSRGLSLGQKYKRINQLLVRLGEVLGIDLWTLDAFWWFLDESIESREGVGYGSDSQVVAGIALGEETSPIVQRFALERHLHNFLLENWNSLELARDWAIYGEPGDEEAGYEFPTEVGKIDLLAKHRHEPRWLVIEFKRDQSADQTVGQVLRYMGWVRKHLAKADEKVSGLIISRLSDRSMPYALAMVPDIDLQTYEVQFKLKSAPKFD